MRILFVTHVTGMAGANRSMFQLIKELKTEYGVEIDVAGPFCDEGLNIKSKLAEIGVRYIDAPITFFKRIRVSVKDFVNYLRYLRALYIYTRKNIKPEYDIVHSNSSVIDAGAYISMILRAKHVWHLREFGDLDYNLYSLGGSWYERFTYKHAVAFIAISKVVASHFNHIISSKKIHTIYNGIKSVDERFSSRHLNDRTRFFCAGVICEAKNQVEIIEAVNILVNNMNVSNFDVTIVGMQDANYVNTIKLLMNRYKINDYITILSEVDGIQELASHMDVGIVPSNAEAFGRVTVEYMLQNLAVIANDAGANLELINDGVTGLIYPRSKPEFLAEKMRQLISNKDLLISIAQSGKDYAKENFLSNRNTKEIFELYKSLL